MSTTGTHPRARPVRGRLVRGLVALGLAAAATGVDSQEPPVFTADVDLVRVHVAVLDRDGQPVPDLRQAEIRVYDGDQEVPVTVLLSPADTPLDVALVLDLSNSMRWQEGRARAERLIATLDADDCVFLLGFSSRVGGSLWASPDDPALSEALMNAEAFGGTALYDAVLVALTELHRSATGRTLRSSTTAPLNPELGGNTVRRPDTGNCPVVSGPDAVQRRRAIVLVSDGMDSTSRARLDDVRVAAALGEASVFPVQLPVDRGAGRGRGVFRAVDGPAVLGELADSTGGGVVDSDREGYARLVALLRGTWVVGYRPAGASRAVSRLTPERRPVRIEVDRPGVTVLHRPERLGAAADSAAARQFVAEAAGFLDDGLPQAAAAALARALAADPAFAPAWHLRAIVRANAGEFDAALDDILHATREGPGAPDRHELAMRIALELGRGEVAWQQAIFAVHAGMELAPYRDRLEALAPPPEDLQARLGAPRVAVARPYVEATNPLLDGATEIVTRALRRALAEAPALALVADPTLADFVASVRARSVDLEPPHRLIGTLRVAGRDGSLVYAGTLNVRDLELEAEVEREARSHVREMTGRLQRAGDR